MAKRRRRKARRSSPRRRRRNPGALLVNPRRRRRRARRSNASYPRRRSRARYNNPRRRRRRNPDIRAFARQGMRDLVGAAIPATIGGLVIGFVDSKFMGTAGTIARTLTKVITAVLLAAVGRRWFGPVGTGVAMGAVLGSIGTEAGVRLGGGMIAMSKKEGAAELVEMAATDAETQAELGALLEGAGGDETTASAVGAYERALAGNAGIPGEYQDALADDDDY